MSTTIIGRLRQILALVGVVCCSSNSLGVVFSGPDGVRIVQPLRPLFGLNVDGVVRVQSAGNTFCNAALLSDNYLLSAASCFDTDADGIVDAESELYRIPFETPGGWQFGLASSDEILLPPNWFESGADLAVMELSFPAPDDIPRYAIYNGSDEIGAEVVIAGHGNTGTGSSGRTSFLDEKLAGKNRYEATADQLNAPAVQLPHDNTLVYDFDSGVSENNALQMLGISSDLGVGIEESTASLGDTGSPTFLNGVIAGVAAYGHGGFDGDINDTEDQTFGELYYDTRVSRFQEFIESATFGEATFALAIDPIEPLRGDLNLDGALSIDDLLLLGDSAAGRTDPWSFDEAYDLDGDGHFRSTIDDLLIWVEQLSNTWVGDRDLDGQFDLSDIQAAFEGGQYQDGIGRNSNWTEGDWNGNGDFTSKDLLFAMQRGGYQQGLRTAAADEPGEEAVVSGLVALTDQIAFQARQSDGDAFLDLNHDGAVNLVDREYWITSVVRTSLGDSDFDNQVDFADFLRLSNGFGKSGGWADGDFDGSGTVEFADFLLLSSNFGTSTVASVPEPGGLGVALWAAVSLIGMPKRRYRALP